MAKTPRLGWVTGALGCLYVGGALIAMRDVAGEPSSQMTARLQLAFPFAYRTLPPFRALFSLAMGVVFIWCFTGIRKRQPLALRWLARLAGASVIVEVVMDSAIYLSCTTSESWGQVDSDLRMSVTWSVVGAAILSALVNLLLRRAALRRLESGFDATVPVRRADSTN